MALARIQTGQPVPRGTLRRSSCTSRSPSCAGSASTRDTEARVRAAYPKQTGMLVVEQVIPESAASDALEPGDILVEVDGKLIAEFVPLAVSSTRPSGSR